MTIRALFVALALVWLPCAASADEASAPAQNENRSHAAQLDRLFDQLKQAKDAPEAEAIGGQIERIWQRSGSDTADLLLKRAAAALVAGEQDVAYDLLDSILALQPDWAEGWNRRATLDFMRKDFDAAVRDIAAVLEREPRHYGAWSGLGVIYLQLDNKKKALAAFKRALEINPQMQSAKEAVEKLTKDIDGNAI